MQASLERLRRRREEEGDEGGFTLIELLIVIVILGILAAIVVFAVQNLTSSSSQASCGSDYKTVETAVEAYKAQIGDYPGPAVPGPRRLECDSSCDPCTPSAATNAAAAAGPLLSTSSPATVRSTESVQSPSGNLVGPWLKDVPRTEATTRSP